MSTIRLRIVGVRKSLDYYTCKAFMENYLGFTYNEINNIIDSARRKQVQVIEFPCDVQQDIAVTNLERMGILINN